ncbi:MAG: haloacid dehalogenase, partial [Deltaproteobacteria bacterium]
MRLAAAPGNEREPSCGMRVTTAPGAGEYVCPMHPEVVREHPGSCPVCGMAAPHAVAPRAVALLELALATPVVLWGGWPFFARGWESVVRASPNMFTLIAIGVGTAWTYSVVAALAPQVFPASFRGH